MGVGEGAGHCQMGPSEERAGCFSPAPLPLEGAPQCPNPIRSQEEGDLSIPLVQSQVSFLGHRSGVQGWIKKNMQPTGSEG